MSVIAVSPLSAVDKVCGQTGALRMISLLSFETPIDRPASIAADDHLVLRFNDIDDYREGLTAPSTENVKQIIDFARNWDRKQPLLVHCWAGVSRSPAAAAIVAMALFPLQDEWKLARRLRQLSPSATPNSRMIALGDNILGRKGRFAAAIEKIGRGGEAFEGDIFMLPLSD